MNTEVGNWKKKEEKAMKSFCYYYIANCHTKLFLLRTVDVMQFPKSKSDDKESQVSFVFAWKSSNSDSSE